MSVLRTLQLILTVSLALCFMRSFAAADPKPEYRLEVSRQLVTHALKEFAHQTKLQVVYYTDVAEGIESPGANGSMSVEEALTKILSGTGLEYIFLNERTIAIQIATPAPGADSSRTPSAPQAYINPDTPDADPAKKAGFWGRFRLAQNDQSSSARTSDSDEQKENFSQRSDKNSESRVIDEVVVTGSRLKRSSSDRGPAPVTIFDRAKIDQLGVTNIADVFAYIPQQSTGLNEQSSFGGSRMVRLRGLGQGAALVLVNGRRTITSALLGAQRGFDLNSIPLVAVERIEVLADSASAVYGADAMGGVVNIILKQSVDQPTVDLYYGAADAGADERRVSLSAGHRADRFRVNAVLDYFERDFLAATDRDRTSNSDFRRFGSTDLRVATSNPANVRSTDGQNLPELPATFASVPVGSSGVGLTPADFLPTAGQTNLTSFRSYESVVPQSERASAALSGEFDVGADLTAFLEFMYSKREDERLLTPSTLSNALVPASNPFNPFGVPVSVRYLFTGIGARHDLAEAESYRTVAGLKGMLGTWDWEVTALDIREAGTDQIINGVNTARALAALASTDPAQALNVFQDGPGGTPALLASLVNVPIVNDFRSDALQGTGFLRGELFALPAGAVRAAFGAEVRDEQADTLFNSFNLRSSSSRSTWAAFCELQVPLVGDDMEVPGVRRLVANIAGRHDHYDDFGGTTNPQIGLQWSVVPRVLIRGSYGKSFRAPSLFELNAPITQSISIFTDPKRGNEVVSATIFFGGNPNLRPEQAESWTAGFVLGEDRPGRARFEVSYWNIAQRETIQQINFASILAFEDLFPGRVVRAAPTPADTAAGRPGALVSISQNNANFGTFETDGVDAAISASFETGIGRFSPSLMASVINRSRTALIPGAAPSDILGLARGVTGTIPKTRATLSLGWGMTGIEWATNLRYVSSYDDASSALIRNGRTVGSQTLVDMQASLDLSGLGVSSDWLRGFTFRAGVTNLFDKEPPLSLVAADYGYDFSQGELRGRFLYGSISKKF